MTQVEVELQSNSTQVPISPAKPARFQKSEQFAGADCLKDDPSPLKDNRIQVLLDIRFQSPIS